jgi:hypothetical protein
MIIEESDFKLKQITEALFDVYLLEEKTKKDGTVVEEFVGPYYGCSLEYALKKIIRNRLKRKNRDGAISMKKLRDDIVNEMKFLHNIFND